MNNGPSNTRIEPTPVRISTNLTIDRQTPKADFGDRLSAGLQTVGGAIASGAAMAAPLVPGSAIVSAAVSSVSQLGGQLAAGTQSGAATAQTYTSGLVGMGTGGTGINTTVGGGGGGIGGVGGGGGLPNTVGGGIPMPGGTTQGGGVDISAFQNFMQQQQQESYKMLGLQMSLNRENQVFTTVSNVLKTRHETVKNTISNVR